MSSDLLLYEAIYLVLGKPSALYDTNPDWAPSLHLNVKSSTEGTGTPPSSMSSLPLAKERYERAMRRDIKEANG